MPIDEKINTSKAGVRQYLDKAAESTKESFHAGSSLKRAFIQMAADAAMLKGADRAKFCKLLDSTPGWFGCGNNSACKQSFDAKSGTDEIAKDYGAW